MKKTLALLTALLLVLCAGTALAETIGAGSYSFTLPTGYTSGEDTDEDGTAYDYYYNDAIELDVYSVEADGMSLTDIVAEYAEAYSASQQGTVQINGADAGYFVTTLTDEDGTYYNVSYILPDGDAFVMMDFYFENESDSAETADIMNTLSGAGTPAAAAAETAQGAPVSGTVTALSSSSLSFILPDGFSATELTDEDTEDGVTGYWYDETTDIVTEEYPAEGMDAEAAAREIAETEGASYEGTLTVNGLTLGLCTGTYTDADNVVSNYELYTVIADDNAEVILFWYFADDGRPAMIDSVVATIG